MSEKLNFTVGPVMMHDYTKEIGSINNPYFRNDEFSKIMFENEDYFLKTLNAPERYRAVFLTGSGTLGMEAVVHSLINENDYSLVINGGSFGARFVELLTRHEKQFTSLDIAFGEILTHDDLEDFRLKNITKLFVNLHETSSGVLYNLDLLSTFCEENNIMLIVDAISAYIADEIDLSLHKVDVLITGSQKALALPPGLSLIALSEAAQQDIANNKESIKSMYLDLHNALLNMERGQTPFTPAIGILLQLNRRLRELVNDGINTERALIQERALNFRKEMNKLNISLFANNKSNALTTIKVADDCSATEIVNILSNDFGIWVTPSGGEFKDKLFRVGHIGCITEAEQNTLINALRTLNERGILK